MRQTPANGAGKFCPRKLSKEIVRGNWTWQVLRDRTIRRCQYAQPFLLSGVPEEHLCAHTWASWNVAAFSRQLSLCPWSAPASENTWVARTGFPQKSNRRGWAGASQGEVKKGPLVVRDCEHRFAEDLIIDEAGVVDPQLRVVTKVSCSMDVLRMRGSYELVEKLWAQFVLTAEPINTEVTCTQDEVLVGSVLSEITSSLSPLTLLFCF